MLNDDILIAQSSLWVNLKIEGKSVKYNQMVTPNVSSHTSSVPSANQFGSYITILSPSLVGHKVYAKITTSNPKIRLGWYITNNSGYDFVDGSALSTSSAVSNVFEGVYEITSSMVHTGTGYLQLYYWLYNGLPTGSHTITIQLVDLTALSMDNIINPVLFNATDLGKVMAHKTLSNGSGILSLKAPLKCYDINDNEIAEINMLKKVDLGSVSGSYMNDDRFYLPTSFAPFNYTQASSNANGYNCYCDQYTRENGRNVYDKEKIGMCLTSPYIGNNLIISDTRFVGKTIAEVKQMLSGVYLYYETATPTELYGIKKASSLLGKQNVETNLAQSYSRGDIFPDANGTFGLNASGAKSISFIANHKYFLYCSFDFKQTNITSCEIGTSTGNITNKVNVLGNNYSLHTFTNTTTETATWLRTMYYPTPSGTQDFDYIAKSMIIIDLTVIGLDNLTAQQFYDQYKDKFEMLANGQSTYLLCNTYENINGRSNVVLGAVDLGTLNWEYAGANLFYVSLSGVKTTSDDELANIICGKYETSTRDDIGDKNVCISNTDIIIKDTAYTNATTFKNSLNGVILIYELATPRTDYYLSRMIPKNVVKIIDDNGMEVDL